MKNIGKYAIIFIIFLMMDVVSAQDVYFTKENQIKHNDYLLKLIDNIEDIYITDNVYVSTINAFYVIDKNNLNINQKYYIRNVNNISDNFSEIYFDNGKNSYIIQKNDWSISEKIVNEKIIIEQKNIVFEKNYTDHACISGVCDRDINNIYYTDDYPVLLSVGYEYDVQSSFTIEVLLDNGVSIIKVQGEENVINYKVDSFNIIIPENSNYQIIVYGSISQISYWYEQKIYLD